MTEAEDHGADDHHDEYATDRETAPQSPYTSRDVAVGFVVAAVGILVAFVVPLLLA